MIIVQDPMLLKAWFGTLGDWINSCHGFKAVKVIDHFRLFSYTLLCSNSFTYYLSSGMVDVAQFEQSCHTYFLCESLPMCLAPLWHLTMLL